MADERFLLFAQAVNNNIFNILMFIAGDIESPTNTIFYHLSTKKIFMDFL